MEYIPNKTNAQRALCDDVSNEIQTFFHNKFNMQTYKITEKIKKIFTQFNTLTEQRNDYKDRQHKNVFHGEVYPKLQR